MLADLVVELGKMKVDWTAAMWVYLTEIKWVVDLVLERVDKTEFSKV